MLYTSSTSHFLKIFFKQPFIYLRPVICREWHCELPPVPGEYGRLVQFEPTLVLGHHQGVAAGRQVDVAHGNDGVVLLSGNF